MVSISSDAVREARRVAHNARRTLRRLGPTAPSKLAGVAHDLETTADRMAQKARQTGVVPDGSTRLVSLHDPDARPIRKGRIRQARRVRLQGPGTRQRGRGDPRPQRRDRQSSRCTDARTSAATHHPARTRRGDRRSSLWRRRRRRRARGDGVREIVLPTEGRANALGAWSRTKRTSKTSSDGAPDPKDGQLPQT
jgi:hypothetical protein